MPKGRKAGVPLTSAEREVRRLGGKTSKSEETRRRMSEAAKNRYKDPAQRNLTRQAAVNRSTPEYRENMAKSVQAAYEKGTKTNQRVHRETYIEKVVSSWLASQGIEHRTSVRILSYEADILVGDLVIECDGEHWHSSPQQKERDAKRDARLRAAGYRVLRVPGKDIYSGTFKSIITGEL